MSIAALPSLTTGPLTPDHQRELASAGMRLKKLRSAAHVAAFNGWMTGFFALCSAPFAPFSVSGFLVAVGLAAVTYNEFHGRRLLLRFDPAGPSWLGWNQLAFLMLITAYCLWTMSVALLSPSPIAQEMAAKPELREALDSLEDLESLYRLVVSGMYSGIIVLSCIFQGLNAWYYFSRKKLLANYLANTPAWVVDIQRLSGVN